MSAKLQLTLCIVLCLLMLPLTGRAQAVEIVALGASNTWGKGVGRDQAYPRHLERMLRAKGVTARVRNAGINGNTTGQMLKRLKSNISARTKLVILQPGGNDRRRGVSREVRRNNIRRIKRYLRNRGIGVVMLRNRLIGSVAKRYRRPDGQHFKADGYRALAARLLPRVLAKLRR
ncbi:SGNH/GDSL hydrolase family protein [Anderseniella sp. Alg231-50]|uniref:SGNH/GDSL hydrolase family protein n=1 Tax=Anderseniella sp. Alg231-50 TaxID=1922226 RepID=UPI00307B1912